MGIEDLLKSGPLIGKELYILSGIEIFQLWRACKLDNKIVMKAVGKKYLRFDKNVPGYVRLSPAIEREFLTYTVVGLDLDEVERKAKELENEIIKISEEKLALSRKIAREILDQTGIRKDICFIIGGDVPHRMAHRDPRPERSTGEMVSGSDLDIIVVASDNLPENEFNTIDESMYLKKHALLRAPVKEEIDYLVKRFSKVEEQTKFDSFDRMVACKIIAEGEFLHGDKSLYQKIIRLLEQKNIYKKLEELEYKAKGDRKLAEEYLLKKEKIEEEDYLKLFSTTEEFSEIF